MMSKSKFSRAACLAAAIFLSVIAALVSLLLVDYLLGAAATPTEKTEKLTETYGLKIIIRTECHDINFTGGEERSHRNFYPHDAEN